MPLKDLTLCKSKGRRNKKLPKQKGTITVSSVMGRFQMVCRSMDSALKYKEIYSDAIIKS